ncbi:hypothetical protein AVEN_78326-1 [Araneus ventricosus]|uniref:Uncharacterized protein n=1 Tax=Araneus ventricosus TaxID=182803 RepID=A0A4Y2WHK5_ARAVE|nr:hypothetical protein AVEN_78326-1 [Araneus ventricosus]
MPLLRSCCIEEGMMLPVRHTNTKKKRMRGHKKHDMKYFCCLGSNDGDGKMEFQGLSDSCEVVQSTETKRKDYFSCSPMRQRHRRWEKKINESRYSEKQFN